MSDSNELPTLDVDDTEAKLREVNNKISSLHRELVTLGLDHLNKVTGSLLDNDVLSFRDSITHRLHSLRYHFLILIRIQNAHSNQAQEMDHNQIGPGFLYSAAEDQFSIFDSIVFHSCSLFDYFGYLCSYLCDSSNLTKRSWNSIVKAFRDSNNDLSKCFVAPLVLEHHRDWVDKLYDRRSDLIHYKMDVGSATSSLNPLSGARTLTVYAPSRFVKAISELRKKSKTHRLSLRYVAFWLIEKVLDTTLEITIHLRQVIEQNRRILTGSEPIQFRNPDE